MITCDDPRVIACCDNGCGECGVVQIDVEVSVETFPNGNKTIQYEPRAASNCCGMGIFLWNTAAEDEVRP